MTQHEEQPKPIIKNAKAKKPKNTSRVQWREDTVDNEGLNKLKSNCNVVFNINFLFKKKNYKTVCCIYHNPHESADLSPSTCSSDDAGNELDRDRKTKKRHLEVCSKRKNKDNNHENCGSGHKH